ncbi:hypothetical protein V8E36_005300 [Tilletia maclaganii]
MNRLFIEHFLFDKASYGWACADCGGLVDSPNIIVFETHKRSGTCKLPVAEVCAAFGNDLSTFLTKLESWKSCTASLRAKIVQFRDDEASTNSHTAAPSVQAELPKNVLLEHTRCGFGNNIPKTNRLRGSYASSSRSAGPILGDFDDTGSEYEDESETEQQCLRSAQYLPARHQPDHNKGKAPLLSHKQQRSVKATRRSGQAVPVNLPIYQRHRRAQGSHVSLEPWTRPGRRAALVASEHARSGPCFPFALPSADGRVIFPTKRSPHDLLAFLQQQHTFSTTLTFHKQQHTFSTTLSLAIASLSALSFPIILLHQNKARDER